MEEQTFDRTRVRELSYDTGKHVNFLRMHSRYESERCKLLRLQTEITPI